MLYLGIRLDADHQRNRDKRHVYGDVLKLAIVIQAKVLGFQPVDIVAVAIEYQRRCGYVVDTAAEDQVLARFFLRRRGLLRILLYTLLRRLLSHQHPAKNQYRKRAERVTPVGQQHVPSVLSAIRAREAPMPR